MSSFTIMKYVPAEVAFQLTVTEPLVPVDEVLVNFGLETFPQLELKTALPLAIFHKTSKFPVVIDWSMMAVFPPRTPGTLSQ